MPVPSLSGVLMLVPFFATKLLSQDIDLTRIGAWPGYLRGPAAGIEVAGDYAYVPQKQAGLLILDIKNPTETRRVGSVEGSAWALTISGNYACVSDGREGVILDIANPVEPKRLGAFLSQTMRKVIVSGNYLFSLNTANDRDELTIVDIADPTQPKRISSYASSGKIRAFALSGQYAYLLKRTELEVIDIGNPQNLTRAASYPVTGTPYSIVLSGKYGFMVSSGGLIVLDITDPLKPLTVTTVPILDNPASGYYEDEFILSLSGARAYVAGRSSLQVIDISNPVSPKTIALHQLADQASGVAFSGNYALVSEASIDEWSIERGGLESIDIAHPALVERVAGYNPDGWRVRSISALEKHRLLLAENTPNDFGPAISGRLEILDADNPLVVQELGRYETGPNPEVLENRCCAYLFSDNGSALDVIDLVNPLNLVRTAAYDFNTSLMNMAVRDDFLYAAGYIAPNGVALPRGQIEIFDVKDPRTLISLGKYDFGHSIVRTLAVLNDYAYVTVEHSWSQEEPVYLKILDVSNPVNPELISEYRLDSSRWIVGVAVSTNRLYITHGSGDGVATDILDVSDPAIPWQLHEVSGGLAAISGNLGVLGGRIVDLSDPFREPRPVFGYSGGNPFVPAVISGTYAYLSPWSGGLDVIDLSQAAPQQPFRLATSGYARAVAVLRNYAYLADDDQGLQVIDISDPTRPRKVSEHVTPGTVSDIGISDGYAYVAEAWRTDSRVPRGRLVVMDLADPKQLNVLYTYDITPGFAPASVVLSGNYAYLSLSSDDYPERLEIIDITNPRHPKLIGAYQDEKRVGWSRNFSVSAGYAYLPAFDLGVYVIDVGTPAQPTKVATIPVGGRWCQAVALSGRHAYLGSEGGGLDVADISDPRDPKPVGAYRGIGVYRIVVSGTRAFATASGGALCLFDVNEPANPKLMGKGEDTGYVNGVIISGDNAYVAAGEAGLHVLNLRSFRSYPQIEISSAKVGNEFTLRVEPGPEKTLCLQQSRDLRNWQNWRVVTNDSTAIVIPVPYSSDMFSQFYRAQVIEPDSSKGP